MKLLALLLSMIVMTLSSVPCCALEDSEANHNTQESTQNEDDCARDCSPFYTCGTCFGFTINNVFGELFALCLKPSQHNSLYLPFELDQTASSIWQPPRLA